jgi:hypothetical protein
LETSALFSSLDPRYGTDTAPEEQAASNTGNEQGPSGQPSGTAPMSNLISAIMRGAAKVQGQEQAKSIASKQAAANSKMSITMKPGEPGDPPFVTVKDAPADLLNGTQAADVEEAYTRPGRQVEAKIASAQPKQAAAQAPAVQAPTTPPPPDHPLEQAATLVDQSLGYRIARPWDPDIAEKLKSEDGIRQIAEEMGDKNPGATAHQAWRQIQHGKVSAQAVQQRVANFRLQKLEAESNRIEAAMAPAARQATAAQAAADRKANEERLLRNQTDAEQAAANKEKLDWLRTTDLSTIDPDKLEEAAQASTNAPWTERDLYRAKLKQQQDVNKAFLDYTDTKKDTFALGSQPSWEAAKAAFGHPLTPQQDTIGKARWQAARAYAVNKAKDESQKQAALSARMELLNFKIEHEGDVKPVQLDEGFVKNVPATDLLNVIDRVKNPELVLQKKESLLANEIKDRREKAGKANTDVHAELSTPIERRRYGWEVRVADARRKAKDETDRIASATAELQTVQAARAARKTGGTAQPVVAPPPAAAPPARPAPAATIQPHRPVANGQYTPEVEAGIRKAMNDHHIGRQKVIQQLKAAGLLQ